ncbi:MFS domain-containing protein [Candidatus Hydrogenisulfobacillus filiaventi]|uniref:MFS domain-containing protein n=1 Tax=Candidatus Hydrogenisulfobacillus filiaventi TaxID=2707344 RepID=A0A6F8ZHD1_9FIRM|nr:MFS domain-containing protein [Candidatus Hydrogenisulfobacillus filiaventi]
MREATRSPGWMLAVATLDQVAITMSQQGLAVLSVAFRAYARLGVAQMGLLFSTVALGAVLGMLPAGLAADRLGPKRLAWISGAAILLVLGSLGVAVPRHFWLLELLLGLVGLLLPALSLTGATAVTNRFDGSGREGLAIGVRQAATPLGGILAAALFPWLVHRWSLRAVLLLIAANVGFWTLAFARILPPRPPRAGAPLPAPAALGRLLRRLRDPLVVDFLLAPGQYALLTYSLLDLHDRWQVPMGEAGPLLALALLGGFLARIGLGRVSDVHRNPVRLIALTALAGLGGLVLWALLPRPLALPWLMLLFLGLGAGVDGWNALLTAWTTEVTSSSQRGLALGLVGMAGFLGVVMALPVFGGLVRVTGSYRPGWVFLAVIYGLGALVAWRAQGRLRAEEREQVPGRAR